jgi:predicted esterase
MPPSRLPNPIDFSPDTAVIIPPPSCARPPCNVVLFLHGLGDSAASFSAFPRALNLPESLCISLQGPTPLPFDLGGFHWGDDILFDQGTGTMDFDAGFNKATHMITRVLREVLMESCGYSAGEIMLFGFGQGAMAALASAATLDVELGGIISVGGPLPGSVTRSGTAKAKSPVIVLGGSSQSLVGKPAVMEKLKDTFENIQYCKWKKAGDTIPQNREEVLPIMQFFARRLRSRQGVPEGSVEVG